MTVLVNLPDELVAQIDRVTDDRAAFVSDAVQRLLHDSATGGGLDEIARINEIADELNREAEDVLEYQFIS